MFKFILLLAVAFGAALYFPKTRPVVVDTLAPVINPALAWQSKNEMKEILRNLGTLYNSSRSFPSRGREFQQWMDRNFPGSSGKDAWGSPYQLKTWSDSLGLVSYGPDMVVNTEDDLLQTREVERRSRR